MLSKGGLEDPWLSEEKVNGLNTEFEKCTLET